MTLVIDDWHRVTDPATIGALLYLLVYASDDLTVVVTSRSQSGLPMSRMRMQDELLEIDATALRFDVAESENFLVDLSGLDLDHTDVEELTAKTDGWVAALQLASLSLRGRDDPVRLIGTMTGRHHAISEFLAENVLDTLEPSMLDFLLATSITERICGGPGVGVVRRAGRAGDARTGRGARPVPAPDRRAVVPLPPAVPSTSCGTGSAVTSPSGSCGCTAWLRRGSPSTDWSARRSITRWRPAMTSGR